MLNGYWLGQQRRDRMLALAIGSAAVQLAAAIVAPQPWVLAAVALSQIVPAFAVVFVLGSRPAEAPPTPERDRRILRRYVLSGVAIGVLTPLATVAVRAIVSLDMSWHEVGLLQALWRVSDWVASVAAGMMSVHFLPRFAAAYRTPQFAAEFRRAALATIVPAAAALALLAAFQRPVFALFYDAGFRMSDATVALFFAGTLARIASWLPLYALYAMRRAGALVIGEFLSMPLFAVLIAAYPQLTLEAAGALWLAAYLAYGLFNLWAVKRAF
jgi:PST family polysaccharide transporter